MRFLARLIAQFAVNRWIALIPSNPSMTTSSGGGSEVPFGLVAGRWLERSVAVNQTQPSGAGGRGPGVWVK